MPDSLLPRQRTAEISRFAISKAFRQRFDDGLYANEIDIEEFELTSRRAVPSITLGLMRAIFQMATAEGITHLTAVIDPALDRLLKKLGIYFNRTDERVMYHGVRLPVYRHMGSLLSEICDRRPDVGHAIAAE